VSSLDAGSGSIATTGTLSGGTSTLGATTVSSLDAGSGSIQTTGTVKCTSYEGDTMTTRPGATYLTLKKSIVFDAAASTSDREIRNMYRLYTHYVDCAYFFLKSGETAFQMAGPLTFTAAHAITTTGTLSAGAATVTSLNAGSGAISTTGALSGGATTVTSITVPTSLSSSFNGLLGFYQANITCAVGYPSGDTGVPAFVSDSTGQYCVLTVWGRQWTLTGTLSGNHSPSNFTGFAYNSSINSKSGSGVALPSNTATKDLYIIFNLGSINLPPFSLSATTIYQEQEMIDIGMITQVVGSVSFNGYSENPYPSIGETPAMRLERNTRYASLWWHSKNSGRATRMKWSHLNGDTRMMFTFNTSFTVAHV